MKRAMSWAAFAAATSVATVANAQDATTFGEPHVEASVLGVSIVVPFSGDANGDGTVAVRYRVEQQPWVNALPLMRVEAGSNGSNFTWGGRHAGSLFGIPAGSDVEIELTASDPDGGSVDHTVVTTTPNWPSIDGVTFQAATPDTLTSLLRNAQPGDAFELADGSYDGINITRSGAEGAPIVLRGGPGAVVTQDVRFDGQDWIWLEGFSVRGQIKFNNADHIVIKATTIDTRGDGNGIVSIGDGTNHSIFVDNTIRGLTQWDDDAFGVDGDNLGDGVMITGSNNVVAYNRISGFRDCVSLMEDASAGEQRSIDIVGNDLSECADDGVEADFGTSNVRVVDNRLTNTFIALSSQPSLGGPTYFVRNVVFNVIYQTFKPHRRSRGDVFYHNTSITTGNAFAVYTSDVWDYAVSRNNLFVGGTGGYTYAGYNNGNGAATQLAAVGPNSSLDYDGFHLVGVDEFRGRLGDVTYRTFEEFIADTTQQHATHLGDGIFVGDIAIGPPHNVQTAPDLRLADASDAIDRGVALPGINDHFRGAAPDLGAYEAGGPPVEYGPRTAVVCGDGIRHISEQCDDGNTVDGDGCSATCTFDTASPDPDPDPDPDPTPGDDVATGPDAGPDTPGPQPDAGEQSPDGGNNPAADGTTATDGCCGTVPARGARGPLLAVLLLGVVIRRRMKRD